MISTARKIALSSATCAMLLASSQVVAQPAAHEQPGPRITTTHRVDIECSVSPTHTLAVEWSVENLADPVGVRINVVLPDGRSAVHRSQSSAGSARIALGDIRQGVAAIILASVEDSEGGQRTVERRSVVVQGCAQHRPTGSGLGLGIAPPERTMAPAPILGTDLSTRRVNETAIAHVRGTPEFGVPIFVAAAGAGGSARLLTYRLDANSPVPVHLASTEPFPGQDVKLLALKPEGSPNLGNPLLISAIRRGENLWLTSWQVEADGTLSSLGTRGYGINADVRVQAYAIAHQPGGENERTIVVTPVRTQAGHLRTITWSVSPDGTINGLHDSGDWGTPASDTEVSIARDPGLGFVIAYRTAGGVLSSDFWSLAPGGQPNQYGGGASGLDIRGTSAVSVAISDVAALPLNGDGFLTALLRPGGAAASGQFGVEVHVWEPRVAACDGACWSMPFAITDNTRDQRPDDFGIDIEPDPTPTPAAASPGVRELLTDGLVEAGFGPASGRLFEQLPQGEITSVHMASVAKNTTLLLAVEAVNAGAVALSDPVTVSANAASLVGPNSSNIGLETGETQSLRTLLHGMMLRSGNDAAAAVAEHVSGTTADFVTLMNTRSDELGLSDTSFGQGANAHGAPAGGGISTPQDQVTLWMFGRELPLFQQIAQERLYAECGTDADGDQKCHVFDKFPDSGYPGLGGWKGGNGGFAIPNYSGPFCVGSGCLVAEAVRLGRPMVVGIQNSGDRWGDADEMFDYGLRLQYTPDHRADSANQGGLATDFGLDAITDRVAVTAQVESSRLKVCHWGISVDDGLITQLGCQTPDAQEMIAGPAAVPTQVDGVRVSRLLFEGDYLTGHLHNDLLTLNSWRTGPREP